MRLPMVARTRPDPVTPVSLEGKNASASEVPETRDTSTSTRSNMAMVFVGVVLGLSFLAFVLYVFAHCILYNNLYSSQIIILNI